MDDQRARLLRAALGFLRVPSTEPELRLLHHWLDCWRGIGDVVVGMKRHGYEVSLGDHGSGQWIAVFYEGMAAINRWRPQERSRRQHPWAAVQRAAGDALHNLQAG